MPSGRDDRQPGGDVEAGKVAQRADLLGLPEALQLLHQRNVAAGERSELQRELQDVSVGCELGILADSLPEFLRGPGVVHVGADERRLGSGI